MSKLFASHPMYVSLAYENLLKKFPYVLRIEALRNKAVESHSQSHLSAAFASPSSSSDAPRRLPTPSLADAGGRRQLGQRFRAYDPHRGGRGFAFNEQKSSKDLARVRERAQALQQLRQSASKNKKMQLSYTQEEAEALLA